MKKNILMGGFLIIFFGTAFFQYKNTLPQKKALIVPTISITQIVTIDGKKNQFPSQIKMGSTALQMLSSSHKVITKGEKENAYITTIDGRAASETNREFWAFYVNGKQAQVGAGSYKVKNNDTIEWKIETY